MDLIVCNWQQTHPLKNAIFGSKSQQEVSKPSEETTYRFESADGNTSASKFFILVNSVYMSKKELKKNMFN